MASAQQFSVGNPEIQRILNDLKTKVQKEDKEKSANELRNAFQRNLMHSDEILQRLLKLIDSADLNDKMGGLIGVDAISFVIQENQQLDFVNKYINQLPDQILKNQDEHIQRKTSEIYGKLLRMGSTKIVSVMEKDVKGATKQLKNNSSKEYKKLGAILILQQLLKEAPFITFNLFFTNQPGSSQDNQKNNQFLLIMDLIKSKNSTLREEALNFFNECVKQISQRESNHKGESQKEWLKKFFVEIQKTSNSTQEEVIYGNINVINTLLKYANEQIFANNIRDIISYVLGKKDSNKPQIQKAVIITIPKLAKYGKNIFTNEFLDTSIQYLVKTSKIVEKKSISYQTLSDLITVLDKQHIKDYAKIIIKTIQEALQQNKTKKLFCIECITCLESILLKFKNKITDFVDHPQILMDYILLNGLHPQSIHFFTLLSKYLGSEIGEYIQCKLLLAISVILIGKMYSFSHSEELDKLVIHMFQNQLKQAINNIEFKSDEGIAQAISTLSDFNFDAYLEDLAKFVKDCVLQYLDNPKPKIRKAAAQAGCLLYVKKGKGISISKNYMYEILEKFLNVAISDPENEIRQEMLLSLNENFDQYMISPNFLRKLFLCVNDTNTRVQELALMILCRLSRFNPSDIVPFMKKILFQYLSQLPQYEIQNEEQVIDLIQLLTCLIKYGGNIVKPHSESIASILIKHLKDPMVSSQLIPPLLKAFAQLTGLGDPQVMAYLYEIIPICLQAIQDKSYTAKREAAVKALVEICKNTGYVILPYYRYTQLMEITLNLLKNEVSSEIRNDTLRLMGCLGVVDHFYYKRVNLKLQGYNSNQEEKMHYIDNIINGTLNRRFISTHKYEIARQNEGKNNLVQELHKYYEDLILMGNFNQQKKMFLNLANIEAQFGFSVPQYNHKSQFNPKQIEQQKQNNQFMADKDQDVDIDELLSAPTVIQLNNTDYYSSVTIKTLLKILCDSSLRAQHDLAIKTLMVILGILKSRTAHFLHLIIPVFKKIIKSVELKDKLLKLIEKIIRNCGQHFGVEWIDSIIQIFLEYANDPKSTNTCFDIMVTLITYCRNHLRHKIELLIREVNSLIMRDQSNKDLIKKALTMYRNLGDLLDAYLHMIIPFLCKIITYENDIIDSDIRKEIISLFECLSTNCSSTIQHLSLIVERLIQVMDMCHKTPHNEIQTMQSIVSCFVVFILQYKNAFLVYLPLVNDAISKYNIYNNRYQECIKILLNYGNLHDIQNLLQRDDKDKDELHRYRQLKLTNNINNYNFDSQMSKDTHMFKKIDAVSLIREFDTTQKTLKEDWKEWMRKSSVELLKESPNLVLSPCHSIAEVYPELSTELYNIAFACVWGVLNDKEKEFIISQLYKVINPQTNQNIPIEILQTILNLAEFMQHDKEGLQIDNSTLGDLAERCEAYAKALYYREHEFETASEKTIESLISLYTNLGQKEAAAGLLIYAKKNLKIDLKMTWYERLQNWERALDDYRIKQLNNPQEDNFVPKMRCLNALSDWESLLSQCQPLMTSGLDDIKEHKQHQAKQVMHLAANAAMNLGQWDQLEKYNNQVQSENSDKDFWSAAVNIYKKNYSDAKQYINKCINKLDSRVTGLLLESYNRAYDNILRLQQLFEMEEIIDFKLFQYKVNQLSQDSRGEFKIELNQELDRRKNHLKDIWNDRLKGNPRDLDTWQKVLSVRGLLFSKSDDMDTWLKFSRLALKQDQMQINKRTIDQLKFEVNENAMNEFDYPPKLVIANLQCQYKMGFIKEKEHNEKLTLFLLDKSKNIDDKLKCKIFLNMGKQMIEKVDELSLEQINEVNKLYKQSFDFNKEYHKTWHAYALLNYEAVKIYQNNPQLYQQSQQSKKQMQTSIFSSLKGFIKSIALGCQAQNRSKYLLQDSLRLLQIIFQYGNLEKVTQEFDSSFETIDIKAWIEVVPQIIARLDNQYLLHKLLIHISRHHPQALIYPLTVARKDQKSGRAIAAQKILDDMSTHSPQLVEEASLISEELNRTAIMINEKWYEGIYNAWNYHHTNQNNSKGFIQQLLELHEMMKQEPQSLSEIAFHQTFGNDLKEAEAWLRKYIEQEDEICLCQAFDIYYFNVYSKIQVKLDSLKFVHLENVSPKLLETKNCQISIPGRYKPNKPIIKIACFQPKLEVKNTKQHPRILEIYGSDSKQYTFLLKGKEDLRQDERVMQLFSLVNRLLHNNPDTEKKDLQITRFSVIPLSTQTGLIGWVHDCDTLQILIQNYRKIYNIRPSTEFNLRAQFCLNYDQLPLPNKVEIFRHILENTKGEDLQKVLWLKSNTSETWLERRTNYTRSLATMSIVGYILGLGDRHPSNIMLQRFTGKIVHIDFGDCFEVAMKREKLPERVPFRLTRMLVNAMEACGIEGNYRNISELVMKVCRENKESLLAVLEAFVYDPIIAWKLVTISDAENIDKKGEQSTQSQQQNEQMLSENQSQTQQQQTQQQQQQQVPQIEISVTSTSTQQQQQQQQQSQQQNQVGYVGSMMRQTTLQHLNKERRKTNINIPAYSPRRQEQERERELQQILQQDNEFHREIKNKKALEVIERIRKKLVGRDFKENEQLQYQEQVKKLIIQATSHENICQAYEGWCPFW